MERHRIRLASRQARAGLAAVLVAAGCAGAGGGAQRAGGGGATATVAAGKFTPSSPAAQSYGDVQRRCGAIGITRYMGTDTADQAKQARKPAPQIDGRLCAVAESLLGWDEKQTVPESVLAFLAFHHGIPSGTVPRVVVATIDVESERDLATRLEEPLIQFMTSAAAQVNYGVASTRGSSGGTKVALAMQEPEVTVEQFPRKLEAKGEATLSGRLLGPLENAKVLISGPRGKLEQPESKPGKEFRVPVSCGGQTGRIVIEIRGEEQGQVALAGNFPVYCGIDPPTSVDLPTPGGDAAQQERAIFDEINAERSSAGLAPLQWDDKVAQAARSVSESEAKAGGSGATIAELPQRLKAAGVASPVVLANPGVRRSALDAHRRFGLSPVYRANYMSTEATHGGAGVANGKDAQGGAVAFVTEVFVRELAQMDASAVAPKLREALNKRRASAGMAAFKDDPTLDKVAQEYAQALAGAGGKMSDAKHSQLASPLYKSFRIVDVLSGAKVDPLEFADEKTVITSKEKAIGIGVSQGDHPVLGKNATYVVLVTGTRK
ncbi:MAG: CAP domain-containing protein [Myxococcales bacterium]